MRAEFEWGITEADEQGMVEVHERLTGTDLMNRFGPIPARFAESIVKARRAMVQRRMLTQLQAIKLFEPRPALEALRLLQGKGHLDS